MGIHLLHEAVREKRHLAPVVEPVFGGGGAEALGDGPGDPADPVPVGCEQRLRGFGEGVNVGRHLLHPCIELETIHRKLEHFWMQRLSLMHWRGNV